MYKINFKLMALLLILIGGNAYGQTAYNPFTQNIHFAPEPTAAGFACGSTQTIVFTQGLTTSADATQWQTNPLKVIICLTGFTYDGAASSIVSGSYASNFDWAYDALAANCLIGTQNQTIKGTGGNPVMPVANAAGEIKVNVKVPSVSPIGNILSVNVNLQVPSYMAQFNSIPDDNESAQTQSYCELVASGIIYSDETNDQTVNGIPVATPGGFTLNAHLVGSDDIVVDVVTVAADGSYEFKNVKGNTTYNVIISTAKANIGSTAPVAVLPENWVFTGEDCCDKTGTDGEANGKIILAVTNYSKINANFGIRDMKAVTSQVVIKNFFVSEYNCAGLLSWTTSKEANTSHVDIYRKDGAQSVFAKVATVQSAGASDDDKIYSYIDKEVKSDIAYEYQLTFVYTNAQTAKSEAKSLTLNCTSKNTSINIFPNPAVSELNVLYVTEEDDVQLDLEIVDITGRTIQEKKQVLKSGGNVITFDIASLEAGNYMLHYKDQSASSKGSLKFTKQ